MKNEKFLYNTIKMISLMKGKLSHLINSLNKLIYFQSIINN